jgi:hypothetical protein
MSERLREFCPRPNLAEKPPLQGCNLVALIFKEQTFLEWLPHNLTVCKAK